MKWIKILQVVISVSIIAGVLAMFAAKIASWRGGIFLFRTETHWFNDSITALLTAISIGVFILVYLQSNKK